MFQENKSWVLVLTFCISIVHILFDTLAFKNDIQYWRSRKSYTGISFSSLVSSFVCQVVIMVYLWNEEASWLVMGPAMVSIVIQLWKIFKSGGYGMRGVKTATVISPTAQYDRLATKTMTWILAPLMVGIAIYSLLHKAYASWFDWALGTAVSCVYAFGFALMTPQLFINYQLKSVAHLPWRMLAYRSLNTFIDDVFAFIIKMPAMHRLSCLRDDVVFLIYMYQRWIYPVDKQRHQPTGVADAGTVMATPSQQPPPPGAPGPGPGDQELSSDSRS